MLISRLLLSLGLLVSSSYAIPARKAAFPSFQDLASLPWDPNAIGSDQCRKDVQYWMASLEQYIAWSAASCNADDDECISTKSQAIAENTFAIKQLDSFGRLPADMLDFTMRWQGSYEECDAVKGAGGYAGQFCWQGLAPNMALLGGGGDSAAIDCQSTTQFQWSICMPKSCNDTDVAAFMGTLNGAINSVAQFCKAECHTPDNPKKNAGFWIVMIYCGIVLALMLVASLMDYLTEKGEHMDYSEFRTRPGVPALLTFSMYSNGAEILSTQKRPGQIDCLHCMRAVSMTWVMAGHVMDKIPSADNVISALKVSDYILNDAFLNAFPSVDSFFFIGGVLLAYLFFKEMDRNPRMLKSPVYWTLYYLHRILRLSPPYFLYLGFYTMVYPYLVHGPLTPAVDVANCKKYWWRNVLYIQNFFTAKDFCMGHTWYLSTDMFHHIFAPLLLVPLCLSIYAGGVSALVLLAISIGATYAAYFKYHLPATLYTVFGDPTMSQDAIFNYFKYVYGAPWVRCSPVIIGVLTGYFLHKMGKRRFHLHWLLVIALWIFNAALAVTCVYSLYDALRGKTHLSTAEGASYYAFHRIGWAIALGWVTIACHFNMAGPIKNFMELGFWAPFSRLTYCAYLTHFALVDIILGQERTVMHWINSTESYIHGAIPVFVISYAFSFLWSCGFEIPFMKLEKMATAAVLGRGRPKQPRQVAVENGLKKEAWSTEEPARSNGIVHRDDDKVRL